MARKVRVRGGIPVELENRIVMDEVIHYYKWQYLWFLIIVVGLLAAALIYYVLS
jgi:hypothetical protein